MRRGLFVLLVLFALAGCSDEGSPTVGEPDGSTTTSTSEASTTSSTSPVSTTTPAGEGIALSGPVGAGRVVYSVAADRSELCYRVTVEGVPAATASHLHRAGDDAEVVLELQPPGGDGTVNTCSAADAILVEQLETSPSDFVLDVHTAEGTLRATL
jgi:hypothetical protein